MIKNLMVKVTVGPTFDAGGRDAHLVLREAIVARLGDLGCHAEVVGPTGRRPFGDLGPDDEGELAVALAADPLQGVVRMNFGKPVTWVALPVAQVRELAAALLEKAAEVEARRL